MPKILKQKPEWAKKQRSRECQQSLLQGKNLRKGDANHFPHKKE